MAGIGELSVSVTARTEKAMKNIRSFRKSINRLPGAISGAARSMGGLATAAAGLVGVGAIGNEIKKSFANIGGLAKLSKQTGVMVEELSALKFASSQLGIEFGDTAGAIEEFQIRIGEAVQDGTGPAVQALQKLGLSAKELSNVPASQAIGKIGDALKNLPNRSDRQFLADEIFGGDAFKVMTLLDQGSQGIAKLTKEAERMGVVVSGFDASQVQKANVAFGRIGNSVEGVTNKIAIGLAPIVESVSDSISEWGKNGQVSSDSITSGIRKLGTAIGFVRDGIDFWVRAFKSVRAYITEFIAWAADRFAKLSEQISNVLNKIPGVETEPLEFTAIFADELQKEAEKARREADKAWAAPLPSEGVNKFFDDLDRRIKKSKKEFDEMADDKAAAQNFNMQFGDAAQGLGSMLGNIVGGVTRGFQSIIGNMVNALQDKPLKMEMAQTAQRGSREEFQLLRQLQLQEANKAAQQQQKQTTLLGGVKTGVDRLASLLESSNGKLDWLAEAMENMNLGEAV